ncbi:uncharacterized protein [Branchiostoma lanceolatum]|uniref:uncharacterized protein n=1 Tax=Branchiostoma lanceolatum TaxID=7740 RepID=UPI00345644B8
MAADRLGLQLDLPFVCGFLAVCFVGCCWSQEWKIVSVFENAEIGTEVVNIPLLFGITLPVEKAELPCSIVDGDQYGRFAVDENCTLLVDNPLDYSIQSEYVLKVLILGRVDGEVKVRVQVNDVQGYPPVYNATCETPVVIQNGEERTWLLKADGKMEGVTSDGDVLSTKIGLPETSILHPQIIVNTDNGDCRADVFWAVFYTSDDVAAEQLWLAKIHSISCFSGPPSNRHSLVVNLIHKKANYDPRLSFVRENVPDSWMRNYFQDFIVYSSFTTRSGYQHRFVCQLPETIPPIRIRPVSGSDIRVDIVAINYLWIEIQPTGCPAGRYGPTCQNRCICRNGAYCHAFNGACKCQSGWKGVACDIPKDVISIVATPSDPRDLYISGNVTLHCEVYDIDAVTTSWIFPDGSTKIITGSHGAEVMISDIKTTDNGPYTCQVNDSRGEVFRTDIVLNVDNCAPDRTGQHCEDICNCLHGASCDRWAGCVCPAGWTGHRCQTACPQGTHGYDCRETCECENGACLPSDGACNCTEGWFGQYCSRPCLPGRYGWSCHQICTCKNNATCHHVDGTCKCTAPWTGPTCQVLRNDAPLTFLVPLVLVVAFALIMVAVMYKKGRVIFYAVDHKQETRRLLELELQRLEEDVKEDLQPGWLRRWERKRNCLSPGTMIGMGMFGYVRKSQLHTPEGEVTVAAKSVRTEDAQCYRDFCREAAILVTVHEDKGHKVSESNIIQLLGLITKSPEKFILLEYAPDGDLLNLLRGHKCQLFHEGNFPLTVVRLLRYAEHISRALKELQRLRITHRDVAARNVLITRGDVAKLADFGSARDVYTTTQYVAANGQGNVPVPLKWMALESLESCKYTCQSDVWSFGVFLWEVATLGDEPLYGGRLQLTCSELVGLLRRGVRLDIPRECPGSLYGIMTSCWSTDPSERPSPEKLIELLNGVRMDSCLLVEIETSVYYAWIGVKLTGCPAGRYGPTCQNRCICRNGAYCHAFNGACKCQSGWTGVACDIPKDAISIAATPSDPRDLYISGNATLRCEVYDIDVVSKSWIFPNGSTKIITGSHGAEIMISDIKTADNGPYTCQVNDSRGEVFKTDIVLNVDNCAPDRTGQHCEDVCGCLHGASCDRWAGCVCPAGWTGRRCQTACSQGTHGYGCRETCGCENGACLPSDGACNCTEGWFGQYCSRPCLPGRYGLSCHQICTCKNNATCHHVDGTCKCLAPWTGPTCDIFEGNQQYDTPLTYLVLLVLVVVFVLIMLAGLGMYLYKEGRITFCAGDDKQETRLLLELELQRLEEDVKEDLQPGWLRRWERKPNCLSPGTMIGMGMFGYVRKSQLRTPEGEVTVAAKRCRHFNEGSLLGTVVRLLRYAEHISRALKELQRLRITHRDVAARNVLITRGDVAKLADFGSARDVYTTTQYVPANGQGNVPVPLKWMALESLESCKYTCQSDVWSFGVFLWEIATLGDEPLYGGRLQLTCSELVGLLRRGVRLEIPRECPGSLYGIMTSCWSTDPSERPSPEKLIEGLNDVRMDSCYLMEFETCV